MARSNVIPFVRPAPETRVPEIVLPHNMVRALPQPAPRRMQLALFVAISLLIHAALLMAAWRDPVPLASIGAEVISLEIVVGATAPAGVAPTQGENEVQAAAPEPQPVEQPQETQQVATAQPEQVPVAAEEQAPDAKQLEQPEDKVIEETKARDEPPRETASDSAVAIVPPPPEKPPQPKHARKPVEHAKPANEPHRIDAPTKQHAQKQAKAALSTAANNVGVGRSDNDINYAGLVSAHLRRYQQYPADARSRGEHGTATVTFALDGGGRVTSARLARGSGIASIDQEVQAMVRRASPFPAPPSRHSVSFTVPVTFRLN